MTIARRLFGLLALPTLLLAVLASVGWMLIRRVDDQTDRLASQVTPELAALANVGHDLLVMQSGIGWYLVHPGVAPPSTLEAAFAAAAAEADSLIRRDARDWVVDSTDVRLFAQFQRDYADWNGAVRESMRLLRARKTDAALVIATRTQTELAPRLLATLDEWIHHDQEVADRARAEVRRSSERARGGVLLSVLVMTLMGIVVAQLLVREIVAPIVSRRNAGSRPPPRPSSPRCTRPRASLPSVTSSPRDSGRRSPSTPDGWMRRRRRHVRTRRRSRSDAPTAPSLDGSPCRRPTGRATVAPPRSWPRWCHGWGTRWIACVSSSRRRRPRARCRPSCGSGTRCTVGIARSST